MLAPQYKPLRHGIKSGGATVALWREKVATAAQHAASSAVEPWNDWGIVSWSVAERRMLASTVGVDLGAMWVKEAVEDVDSMLRNMRWATWADDEELSHTAAFISEVERQGST